MRGTVFWPVAQAPGEKPAGASGGDPLNPLRAGERLVAIYHLNVKNISRGDGRSVVTAAAYRAGAILPNEAEERLSDFGGRRDVIASDIRLPEGAPGWMAERGKLWNAVEESEKRKDARLAKELEFALPRELPRTAWLEVARAVADAYAARGFVADLAIHDDGTQHNPHVHILLTTRVVTPDGFGPKIRSADGRQFVTEARALWERIANAALGKAGAAVTIDSRSYAARRLEQKPSQHRGPDPVSRRERRAAMDSERLRATKQEVSPMKAEPVTILFPYLSARPDWPPLSRQPPEDLLPIERDEFEQYWQAVDTRLEDLPPVRDEDLPVPAPDGSPISRAEQHRAEDAMIETMESPARQFGGEDYPAISTPKPSTEERDWWQTLSFSTREETAPEPEHDEPDRKEDRDWWR